MKLVKTASIIVLCVLALAALDGCSPVNKVKRTLALNDIHIQAGIAEEKGDDQRAYELWTEYVDRRPQSVLAEYRLGMVETRLGLIDQAIGHLRIAHDLKPGNIIYLEALAEALAQGNRTDSLMKLLNETLNEGEEGTGYLRLARYAQRVGQMDEAREALLLAIIQNRGESPQPYLEMANFARTLNDQATEIKYLRNVLWFEQSNPAILSRLNDLGMIAGPSLAIKPGM
jgi:tetratricopeptide (TPR) repeat protein